MSTLALVEAVTSLGPLRAGVIDIIVERKGLRHVLCCSPVHSYLLIRLVGNPGTIIGDPLVIADLVPRIAAGRCR